MSEESNQTPPVQPPFDDEEDQLTNLADLPPNLLEEAMKQLTNADKPLLADETSASQPTTAQSTTQPAQAKQSWENAEPVAVGASGKNSKKIICPFCLKSLLLLPNASTHVEQDTFLPFPNAQTKDEGCTVKDFFKVTSKMDFENIEVKRAYPGDQFRYLTCADCGSGPLGITYDSDNNRIFYVSHDRTRYGK